MKDSPFNKLLEFDDEARALISLPIDYVSINKTTSRRNFGMLNVRQDVTTTKERPLHLTHFQDNGCHRSENSIARIAMKAAKAVKKAVISIVSRVETTYVGKF